MVINSATTFTGEANSSLPFLLVSGDAKRGIGRQVRLGAVHHREKGEQRRCQVKSGIECCAYEVDRQGVDGQ
eukprot:1429171-Pyramimonas_sp.AAC.3